MNRTDHFRKATAEIHKIEESIENLKGILVTLEMHYAKSEDEKFVLAMGADLCNVTRSVMSSIDIDLNRARQMGGIKTTA